MSENMNTQCPNRHLAWPHCSNTRDLGGLPTRDGNVTRWKAVIRSDRLSRLTEAGQHALRAYGVTTIIDVRSPQEVTEEPSIMISDPADPLAYMNLPIERYYPHVSTLITQATTRGEVYSIILDHYADAIVAIMRAMVTAPPGGIVVHCHSGTDRTGIVVGVLLDVVGVSAEIIAADYAESQARLWPLDEKTLAEATDTDETDMWRQPTATAEMMRMMLTHVETHHGGAEPYLRTSGLLADEIDLLKRRLVAP